MPEPSPPRARHAGDAADIRPLLSSRSSLQPGVSSLSVEVDTSVTRATDAQSWGRELRLLASLSAPLVAQNVLYLSQALVIVAAVGQFAPHHLPAVVLGTSLYNVTGLSLAIGLSSALETLCAQAAGAGEHAALGLLLQRALFVMGATVVIVLAVWFGPLPALLALARQPPDLAAGAVSFVRATAPALVLSAVNECVRRYLVSMHCVAIPAVAAIASAAVSAVVAVATVPHSGLAGAAAAYCAGGGAATAMLVAGAIHHERTVAAPAGRSAWPGWRPREALAGWYSFLAVALPSAAQVVGEWWTFEVIIFMAGALPDAAIAVPVTGAGFQTITLSYSLPLGVANGVATRVGHELGARRPAAAARAATLATLVTAAASLIVAATLAAARSVWPRVFTSDAAVVAATARVMPLIAAAIVGDGTNGALAGVVRGAGRQGAAALLNLVVYWMIGASGTAYLTFKAGLGLTGLWIGLSATTALQAAVMALFVSRFDWAAEAAAAAERVDASVGRKKPAPVGVLPESPFRAGVET